jgi:4-hydroxy-tetrahydrodipicolinate synthase
MKPFAGAWPTLVTPFNADLSIDLDAYRASLSWYLQHGVGGLYAACLSSEMYELAEDERLLLAHEAVRIASARIPVAATGNLGASLEEHIRGCRRMAETGVDAVMLVVPEFLDDEADLERYYLTIAEQVDAPLGLYECPVPRQKHLSPALVGRLARSGRFVAFKETSCDIDRIREHIAAVRGTPLALLQANTPYMLAAVRAGTPGSMTIAAIWLPELVARVIDCAQANDPAAERLHARLCAMKLAQRSCHPAGTKYLLSKRGLPFTARMRRPGASLPPDTALALDYAANIWFDEHGELREEL